MNTDTDTRKVTFEIPARDRIAEVQAEVTAILDEHTIVRSIGGSGQVLTLTVTFGNQAEIEPLTTKAYLAAMHITPVEMKVG